MKKNTIKTEFQYSYYDIQFTIALVLHSEGMYLNRNECLEQLKLLFSLYGVGYQDRFDIKDIPINDNSVINHSKHLFPELY